MITLHFRKLFNYRKILADKKYRIIEQNTKLVDIHKRKNVIYQQLCGLINKSNFSTQLG